MVAVVADIHPVFLQLCSVASLNIHLLQNKNLKMHLRSWMSPHVMWKTAHLQVLLVLPCNKWWTLWILFIIVPFIYYLQQATVILIEVVCCKSKAVMFKAGWDMLVSRDHLCAVLLICLSWAGICNWWAGQLHWGIYTQGSLTTPYL